MNTIVVPVSLVIPVVILFLAVVLMNAAVKVYVEHHMKTLFTFVLILIMTGLTWIWIEVFILIWTPLSHLFHCNPEAHAMVRWEALIWAIGLWLSRVVAKNYIRLYTHKWQKFEMPKFPRFWLRSKSAAKQVAPATTSPTNVA